jgi:hypothetical protein
MFGSEILDVAVGVIFVFLLVSLICSAVREGIEAWMKSRATHLEQGIRELLHDPRASGLARSLYEHPMVSVLYHDKYVPTDTIKFWTTALTRGRNLPSYIPSHNFALALMDMAARGPAIDPTSSVARAGAITIASLRDNIAGLGSPPVQRVLLTALDSAQGDLQKAQANIEAWYDASMERVSGWYKRSTQLLLFFIGLGVAVTLNINAITIANYLYRDSAARAAMVARAEAAVAEQNYPRTYPAIQTELQSLKLPIGWESGLLPRLRNSDGTPGPNTVDWIGLIGGLLITALAATLGAPFWFDILNKVMVIRSTVKPHEKSPEEASKDRQPAKAASEATPERPAATPSTPAVSTGAPPPQPPAAPPAPTAVSQHPDQIDGCDVDFVDFTPDEELPAAEGGVA